MSGNPSHGRNTRSNPNPPLPPVPPANPPPANTMAANSGSGGPNAPNKGGNTMVQFALTPALAVRGVINMFSSDGRKLYNDAVKQSWMSRLI